MRNIKIIFAVFFSSLFLGCLTTTQNGSGSNTQMQDISSNISVMQRNQAELNAKMSDLSLDVSASKESVTDLKQDMKNLSVQMEDIKAILIAKRGEMLPSEIYKEAYTNFVKGNFTQAKEGFTLYIDKNPKGEFLEDSYYYRGDACYSLKEYKNGAVSYALILKKFPKSERTPATRLKYAKAILELDKKDESIMYLKSIVQDFPKSPESKKAEELLSTLQPATI